MTPIENPKSQIADAPEREILPLSLLNDFLYCPRRVALKIVKRWREEDRHAILGDIAREHEEELIVRAEALAAFPQMGRVVPEFQQEDLREIICRSYRIIHRVRPEQKCIEIVRFWHGARGLPQVPRGEEP